MLHKTIFIALTMLFLVLSVVLSPDVALQASLSGITIWWNLVFPGLLPFFILYELVLAFGLLHGINAMLAPFVTRLLQLPRAAGIPLLMSMSCGFPTGVEPTIKLLEDGQLTKAQAQRLLAYIHLPNPIFIIVIIGAGVFQLPFYGYIILASVWLAALLLMLAHTRLSSRHDKTALKPSSSHMESYFASAMQFGRELDGRTFGQVLGDSVYGSVQKLFIVGGFIIFASVLAAFIHPVFNAVMPQLPFLEQMLLEQHVGSFAIAEWASQQTNTVVALALIAACLGFTGISGILQVTYYTFRHRDIKLLPFVGYRLIHAALSFVLLIMLWKPLSWIIAKLTGAPEQTVFVQPPPQVSMLHWQSLWPASILLCLITGLLILTAHLLWRSYSHKV